MNLFDGARPMKTVPKGKVNNNKEKNNTGHAQIIMDFKLLFVVIGAKMMYATLPRSRCSIDFFVTNYSIN